MNILIRIVIALAAVGLIAAHFLYDFKIDESVWICGLIALLATFGPAGIKRVLVALGMPAARLKEFEIGPLKFDVERTVAEPAATPVAPARATTPEHPPTAPVPLARPAAPPRLESVGMQLLKFIPVETILGYQIFSAMLRSQSRKGVLTGMTTATMEWIAFGIFLIGTIVYLSRLRAPLTQVLVASLIFAAWVLSAGGPFYSFPWYDPSYGAFALVVLVLGLPLAYSHLTKQIDSR